MIEYARKTAVVIEGSGIKRNNLKSGIPRFDAAAAKISYKEKINEFIEFGLESKF